MVRVLLAAGADAGIPRAGLAGPGATPLHEAAAAAHVTLVELLLSCAAPADPNAMDAVGDTPLHYAARRAAEGLVWGAAE